MMRRLILLFVMLGVLAAVAPRASGQFLSDEERRGMFTLGLAYSTREYDMSFRGSSVPLENADAILEEFAAVDSLDGIELTFAWLSFGYVELRGTLGLADHDLKNTHSTDAGYNTTFATSDNLTYGLSATVRYPISDEFLVALEVGFLTGNFDDVEGDISPLDVERGLTSTVDDIDWREVTITPMVLLRYGNFVPYAGVRFANVTTEINTNVAVRGRDEPVKRTLEFENDDDLSAVIGLTWRVTPLIMADLHAQLLNNERITLGVKLTF